MKEYNKKNLGCLFNCSCKSKKAKEIFLCDMQNAEQCLLAVKQNGLALKNVHIQTPEICLEAVKQNGLALQFVWYNFLTGNV
jgi:hypothetical protein